MRLGLLTDLAPRTAVLDGGGPDVWLFEPTAARARALRATLSAAERGRAERMIGDRGVKFAATRGTLRALLGAYLGVEPARLELATGEEGKPALAGEAAGALAFNVSHSGALAAVAVGAAAVGVDVELRKPRAREPGLANRTLAQAERPWFDSLGPGERTAAFYDVWTAKEAYAKLVGRGLALGFSSIALSDPAAAATAAAVNGDGADAVPAALVRRLPLGPRYSGALAVAGPPARLEGRAGAL